MPSLLPSLLTILHLLLLIGTLITNAIDIHCNKPYYGKPLVDDCYHLLSAFPSNQDFNTRIFIEQQLREDPYYGWPGVENDYPDAMVQVPKYWGYSESPEF